MAQDNFLDQLAGTSGDSYLDDLAAGNSTPANSAPGKSYMGRLRDDFDKRMVKSDRIYNNPDITELEKRLGYAGQGWGMAADVINEGISSLVPDVVKKGLQKAGNAILDIPLTDGGGSIISAPDPQKTITLRDAIQKAAKTYEGFEKDNPRIANIVNSAGNAANLALGLTGIEAIAPAAQVVKEAPGKIRNIFAPDPTKDEALGQILQGTTKDYAKGERALSSINLDGVKTYDGLAKKLNDAIPEYSAKVDAELAKDRGLYKINDLSTKQITKDVLDANGNVVIPSQTVNINYVEKALGDLAEMYENIGEKALAQDAINTIEKAKITGLTKKEVNDIARQYGAEFKAKAFGSNGDPLTSVNAQMYENTRSGLKEVSRRGLSNEAQDLDNTMSSIFRTRDLVEKNAEAVNKLRQKIDERGLGEKIGRGLWTAIDMATLGTVKGALWKLMPRGMGYKVKNWIDIEDSLARNLDILQRAGNATSGVEMKEILMPLMLSATPDMASSIPEMAGSNGEGDLIGLRNTRQKAH